MNRVQTSFLAAVLVLFASLPASAQLTPDQAIIQMGRGINLGNTLEPPREGDWNNGPAREYYFDDFKTAGFATVRIPVRWDEHTQDAPPFAVEEAWMDRVEEVVDWGLSRDFFIIINGHHEDWLKAGYANNTLRARYDSIWSQIAVRFKDKSEKLFFEIINEPYGMTVPQVDDLNTRILEIVRRTNPTRIVIFSGNEWSGASQLFAARIPTDDYLMGYYHSYDPWEFAGLAQGTWGSVAERAAVAAQFQSVANWSATHGIPVMNSEFGSVRSADFNSRMAHYAAYVEGCVTHNIACQAWDDGGDFEIYRRDERAWNEAKDILLHTYPDGPTDISAAIVSDSIVTLQWTNRSSSFFRIRVERRAGSGTFVPIAEVPPSTTQYADSTTSGGVTYYYRVIAESGLVSPRYSYPIRVRVAPWMRSSFHGSPAIIPGVIEAEDFDIGGEGLTYHDTDESNVAGAYRLTEAVDIEARSDGGFQVAYIESGEWLEYSVDVQEAGDYLVTAYVASLDGGGQFGFGFDGRKTRTLSVPSTGDWETLSPVSRSISLPQGQQTMRVSVFSAFPFNIDRYVIEKASATSVSENSVTPEVEMYPNPMREALTISYSHPVPAFVRAELFNILGQRVRLIEIQSGNTSVSMTDLPKGVYFVRVYVDEHIVEQQIVVRQ
ncbi:MAG: cellulase family glycosylhydrolase [Rhodothermales bacterium]|nr:cellulase family glycosylhydrolase [Rhodothermales bacterium]